MSDDLDADLYGDLYESQQAEQPAEEKISTAETPTPEKTSSSTPETTDIKPIISAIDTSYTSTPSLPTPNIAPPTQQIPTYEENAQDSPSYGNMPIQRGPGAGVFQNIPGGGDQRTVRPSEMKDEG
ncbi:hypothetical protein Moror_7131 [Moniliophthora roreri MCA 2997]|uniref:Uncharacterized protein n=1 Tax=Moniliophthora roreri (strain MCA 2997) TaxID=1381753 RepID=V2XUW5_MONRO|nr:hypothetical protein Moror_7131 [Moniliophthora roreri MCA 2997]